MYTWIIITKCTDKKGTDDKLKAVFCQKIMTIEKYDYA